jgi:hypothetical protein
LTINELTGFVSQFHFLLAFFARTGPEFERAGSGAVFLCLREWVYSIFKDRATGALHRDGLISEAKISLMKIHREIGAVSGGVV